MPRSPANPQASLEPDHGERAATTARPAPAGASRAGVHDVLMLGWEFPPFITGGLGTACYGLTKAMSRRGDRVLFVIPGPSRMGFSSQRSPFDEPGVTSLMAMPEFENVEFAGVDVELGDPYARPLRQPPTMRRRPPDLPEVHDLAVETRRFSERVVSLALHNRQAGRRIELVHAHDWMTFRAGADTARALGVPFVAHVHSTEYDRRGEDLDDSILQAEQQGFDDANVVVAVSGFTAGRLTTHYGVPREKIRVVHNAVEPPGGLSTPRAVQISAGEQIVLFVGRMTGQKGMEQFVRAAKKVLEVEPAVRFVMTGDGDQFAATQRLAAQLEIEEQFLFTGFLRNDDVEAVYRAASVFVMPSVSEPFGLVSLEAMRNEVPVILSRQSGAAEVLENALKVNFWDIDEMASKIVSVLRDPTLADTLSERGSLEVRQMRWSDAADQLASIYDEVLA